MNRALMSYRLERAAGQGRGAPLRAAALATLVVLLPSAFLVAPWPLEVKLLAALHGLCAQQPSHSFWLGSRRLPLDSRMTGLYLGFVIMLARLSRQLAEPVRALPRPRSLIALLLGLLALAIDGVNSSLAELGLAHLYVPSNVLRYATGALAGVALAVGFRLLLGLTLPVSRRHPAVGTSSGWSRPVLVLPLLGATGLLTSRGPVWLYSPLAVALLVCSVLTLAVIALAGLMLLRGVPRSRRGVVEGAAAALLLSYLGLFLLAAGRFWLEAHVVLPPTAR